jgi:predicted transposase YbfD/YdcC
LYRGQKESTQSLQGDKKNVKEGKWISASVTDEINRGRQETRTVKVFNSPDTIAIKWSTVKTIIEVSRDTVSLKNPQRTGNQTAYFISSLPAETQAKDFNKGIRSHWSIENSLHYVKDKTFKEDACKIRTKNAPENLSLLRGRRSS